MTDITWLGENSPFPPTFLALSEPNGLLAAGGDLSASRLLNAYQKGIFPWYSDGQPIMWWSPSPRTVFIPGHVHCSKSMRKFIRKCDWQVRIDSAFEDVIAACAQERKAHIDDNSEPSDEESGTWITADITSAYTHLHQLGFAHSVEVFQGNELIGGLYGIALGRVFFGESMFSRQSNASKYALLAFNKWLKLNKFSLMDCQVANPHLQSLGAQALNRHEFEKILHLNTTHALIDSMQPLWQNAANKTLTREGLIAP